MDIEWKRPLNMDDLYTTLTEQRRELMAAKTLDSDLDLAYQLQMQEAMNASLALHNPATASSSRTPAHPHPQPNDDDDDDVVFIPQSPNDDVLDIATTLMLEDMYRFTQELVDREQTKAEMRKMKEDLDHRIHDQKLAAGPTMGKRRPQFPYSVPCDHAIIFFFKGFGRLRVFQVVFQGLG